MSPVFFGLNFRIVLQLILVNLRYEMVPVLVTVLIYLKGCTCTCTRFSTSGFFLHKMYWYPPVSLVHTLNIKFKFAEIFAFKIVLCAGVVLRLGSFSRSLRIRSVSFFKFCENAKIHSPFSVCTTLISSQKSYVIRHIQ
jgi:hypothetical protein